MSPDSPDTKETWKDRPDCTKTTGVPGSTVRRSCNREAYLVIRGYHINRPDTLDMLCKQHALSQCSRMIHKVISGRYDLELEHWHPGVLDDLDHDLLPNPEESE